MEGHRKVTAETPTVGPQGGSLTGLSMQLLLGLGPYANLDTDILVTAAGRGWGELREGTLKRLLQMMADLAGSMTDPGTAPLASLERGASIGELSLFPVGCGSRAPGWWLREQRTLSEGCCPLAVDSFPCSCFHPRSETPLQPGRGNTTPRG